jgi:hypothetical protein
MIIDNIDNLKKQENEFFYDLFSPNFIYRRDIVLYPYVVQVGEEMRIDLVMQSINIQMKDLDVIIFINNIDNPLNIRQGTIILHPSSSDISKYRIVPIDKPGLQESLSPRPNKTTRKDPNRQKYVQENNSLPPVVNDSPKKAISVEGRKIRIGGI